MKLLSFLGVLKEINPHGIFLMKIHGILNRRFGSSDINRGSIPRRADNEEARVKALSGQATLWNATGSVFNAISKPDLQDSKLKAAT